MTPPDIRELLPLYALGILDASDRAVVEAAVASDPDLAAELAGFQATAELLVAAVPPAPDVAARLLASTGGGRFEKLSLRIGSLFDVAVDKARELVGLIERPASWEQEQGGIALVHFAGGPACAAADCGFVRLEPGAIFPPHKHLGEEVMLVLQGQLRDGASHRLLGPGDLVTQPQGSEHHLTCEGSEPCIFAARAMNGIEVAGMARSPARPGDPNG